LEAEISDNDSSSYCWWWCYNNGYEGTSFHSLLQMNSHGLSLLTESATNSKYLRLCTQGSMSLSSYTGCVECYAVCWKQFQLKKELLQVVFLKIDICYNRTWQWKNYLKIDILLLQILVLFSNSSVPRAPKGWKTLYYAFALSLEKWTHTGFICDMHSKSNLIDYEERRNVQKRVGPHNAYSYVRSGAQMRQWILLKRSAVSVRIDDVTAHTVQYIIYYSCFIFIWNVNPFGMYVTKYKIGRN
jgi:hypothetical protein